MADLETQLTGWTGPSSATEQDKQDRTERMIRAAIDAHPAFATLNRRVYAKGSYANNTNVKSDSDVDIAVECTNVVYFKAHTPGAAPPATPYSGEWTPDRLRTELVAALRAKFGDGVDSSGSTAIQVHASSARVEADVVPCFEYHHYFSHTNYREGTKVFRTDGTTVVNYSALQLEKGRAKNNRTNKAYKKTVRILKRLENAMAEAGYHRAVPSYLVECLVYNCPDAIFGRSTWTSVVKGVVAHIFNATEGPEPDEDSSRWLEVSEGKYLFNPSQKWSRKDARDFAFAAWQYLKLADA